MIYWRWWKCFKKVPNISHFTKKMIRPTLIYSEYFLLSDDHSDEWISNNFGSTTKRTLHEVVYKIGCWKKNKISQNRNNEQGFCFLPKTGKQYVTMQNSKLTAKAIKKRSSCIKTECAYKCPSICPLLFLTMKTFTHRPRKALNISKTRNVNMSKTF